MSGKRIAQMTGKGAFASGSRRFLRAVLAIVLSVVPVGISTQALAQSAFDDPGARSGGAAGGSGSLAAVKPVTEGGSIAMGSAAQIVLLFRNEGAKPITTGAINLYPSSSISASIVLNQCVQEPLPAGAECAVALSVKGLQPGPWRVEMLMRHDGRERLVTASATGTVVGSSDGTRQLISDVEAIPADLAFGSLQSSRAVVKSVILRNITSNPLEVKSVTVEASPQAGYAASTDCARLEAGQACVVTVTWAPIQRGPSTGVLVVTHSGPTGVVSVGLDGKYDPENVESATLYPEAVPGRGLLVASSDKIDFGTGIASKSSVTVSLVNSGDAPLVIGDIRLSATDNGVDFGKDGCTPGTMLDPVEACPLTVTWSPVRTGALIDDIQVHHDGARGILVIPVRGDAAAPVSQDSQSILLSNSNPGMQLDIEDLTDDGDKVKNAEEKETKKEKGKKKGKEPKEKAQEGEEEDFVEEDGDMAGLTGQIQNKIKTLDGYQITSTAPTRAIVSGPGGSRVVFDGEETVIGGVPWAVKIRPNGVEFFNNPDRVMILFDRSLSSVNRVAGQSNSGKPSSGDASGTSSSSTNSTTTTASTSDTTTAGTAGN